jgi:tetratricopeptide (TPR) repeat protein
VLGIKPQQATITESYVKETETVKAPAALYDMSSDAAQMQEFLERGELAAKDGQFETAVRFLLQAENLNPTSARVLKAIGAVYLATNDAAKALGYFERAVTIAPNDSKVLTGRGMCEVLTNRYAAGMPYFERALEADPTHLVAIHQLLRCAYETNNLDSSERVLTAYLDRKPQDYAMRFCLAGCLYRQGKHQHSLREVSRVIELQPQDAAANDLKALIEQALAAASVTTEDNKRPAVSASLSELNQSLTELSTAMSEWEAPRSAAAATANAADAPIPSSQQITTKPVVTTQPVVPIQTASAEANPADGYIESRLNMVDDLRRDRKVAEARRIFEAVRNAIGMSARQASWAKCIEAEFLVLDGDLVTAEAVYSEVVAKEPRNARALCGKGALAGEGQKWQEARRFFEEALSYQPSYDVALAGLGLCEMVENKSESAFDLFQKAAKANPENQRALFGVLQVGYPLKRYREIEELLVSYLDLHPANVDMLYSFAGVLFAQGKLQQARMEVEKILLFEPTNSRALELRKVIETDKTTTVTVTHN